MYVNNKNIEHICVLCLHLSNVEGRGERGKCGILRFYQRLKTKKLENCCYYSANV